MSDKITEQNTIRKIEAYDDYLNGLSWEGFESEVEEYLSTSRKEREWQIERFSYRELKNMLIDRYAAKIYDDPDFTMLMKNN